MVVDCTKKNIWSMGAGALAVATGLDTALPLPPEVHYLVAGAGVNLYCADLDPSKLDIMETLRMGAFAYGGAFLYAYMMSRGS